MRRLFEGGVYLVGSRRRGRRLFEGHVYSRVALKYSSCGYSTIQEWQLALVLKWPLIESAI